MWTENFWSRRPISQDNTGTCTYKSTEKLIHTAAHQDIKDMPQKHLPALLKSRLLLPSRLLSFNHMSYLIRISVKERKVSGADTSWDCWSQLSEFTYAFLIRSFTVSLEVEEDRLFYILSQSGLHHKSGTKIRCFWSFTSFPAALSGIIYFYFSFVDRNKAKCDDINCPLKVDLFIFKLVCA